MPLPAAQPNPVKALKAEVHGNARKTRCDSVNNDVKRSDLFCIVVLNKEEINHGCNGFM